MRILGKPDWLHCLRGLLRAALTCLTACVAAQQPPDLAQTGNLTIKSSVRRVIVDVSVIDSNGKPVRNLEERDFSLAEDGKPQQVLSFEAHSSDAEPDFVPPRIPPLPPNSFVNVPAGPEKGPLNVLLLDLMDTGTDDQPFARVQLEKFLSGKPEGARFAVFVLSDGLHLVQAFTDDRRQLLDILSPGHSSHVPKIFLYGDNYRASVSSLQALIDVANFLSGLPGHKNVYWLAGSFPFFQLPESDPGISSLSFTGAVSGSGGTLLVDQLEIATNALTRAQASVYPVDVRGTAGGWIPGQHTELNASYLMEDAIADATGGHAYYSTNDVKGALADATERGSNYYTLTYSPTNQKYDGSLRHVNVELGRRGFHLAYRRSYYANPNVSTPVIGSVEAEILSVPGTVQKDDSLYIHMQHGAPTAHQLIFAAHVHTSGTPAKATHEQVLNLLQQPAYFKDRKKQQNPPKEVAEMSLQPYTIDYKVLARQLGRSNLLEPPTLEFAVAAFDDDGQMLNAVVQKAETPATERSTDHHVFFVESEQIEVPVKAAWLRFAVRDTSTDKIGAMEVALPLAPESPRAQINVPRGAVSR